MERAVDTLGILEARLGEAQLKLKAATDEVEEIEAAIEAIRKRRGALPFQSAPATPRIASHGEGSMGTVRESDPDRRPLVEQALQALMMLGDGKPLTIADIAEAIEATPADYNNIYKGLLRRYEARQKVRRMGKKLWVWDESFTPASS